MLTQNIDCQKCGFSNKLGTIYCRNCGAKLKFDKRMLGTEKGGHVKKVISRVIKALVVIVLLVVAGLAFSPWGFPEPQTVSDPEEIKAIVTTCEEIDMQISKDQGKGDFEFTAPELTYAINYLAVEHEKKAAKAAAAPPAFGSGGSNLDGVSKLGGADLGSKPSMQLSKKTDAAPSQPAYVDKENARRQSWQKRKQEDVKNAGKRARSPHFDFVVSIKDEKTLGVTVKERWIKYIPCRLELYLEPVLENNDDGTQKLRFKITGAYFGRLPLPLFLEKHIIALFEEVVVQEREWAKHYLQQIQNVQIHDALIKITIAK